MTHRTASIRFPKAKTIEPEELRRVVNKCNNWANPILHKHGEDEMDYPLVQYRNIAGKPAIWAIDEGIDALEEIIDELTSSFSSPTVVFEDFEPGKNVHLLKYKCPSFLPFNEDNYKRWKNEISHVKRMELLEHVLKGHLANFYQSLGFDIKNNDFACVLHSVKGVPAKVIVNLSGNDVRFLGFNIIFFTDLLLPSSVGIGKCKAKGHGITLPM
ncbi:hypothetical protein SAMN06298216_4432 [Spirosomataceae bacterium TFI 002]|nr:hypothetical protein SAMN06298216_4432 [Spirosomataceae bacterium TFI 002]